MQFEALLSLWWTVLLSSQLGSMLCVKVQTRIVGGTATTISKIGGFVVNLRYDGEFYCGGSLVSPRFVVSAGHCAYQRQVNRLTVQGGVSRLTETGVIRRVQKVMMPRSFNIARMNMDVAVLKLQAAMSGAHISTVPLCTSNWHVGDYMRVSGWGTTSDRSQGTPVQLRTVRLRLVAKSHCRRAYRKTARLMGSAFCAYSRGKDSCSGDSGGGVIYRGQLCGIVSWGVGCAERQYPGVYTSIYRTRSFITKAMKE